LSDTDHFRELLGINVLEVKDGYLRCRLKSRKSTSTLQVLRMEV